jgi:ubiquinol-cytochrome c reductase cytochrome c subunit
VRRRAAWLLVVLVVPACAYASRGGNPYRPAIVAASSQPADGRVLYLRDCAWCHGSSGEGTARGPDLLTGTNGPALTDFMLRTGRMPLDSPEERSRHGPPAYTREEITAIVEYASTFGAAGPDIPLAEPDLGDLSLGEELYLENCAACHSTTLIGGALTSDPATDGRPQNAPNLRSSAPTEIEEAMLTGPGGMPVFGPETFTSEEVDSIVRYVTYLQDPPDKGGAPLGHIGPVTEGAVAWILGLGALLLVARWIGTKTEEMK